MNGNVQPVFIMPEDTQREAGKDAQRKNILAGKQVAQTIRTTLGPKGMDKMMVDSVGDVIITNDGVTILEEMEIEHPAAKMMVEVAKTQEEEVGDGTTTAVVIGGELLKNSEDLLEKEIHPTVITRGLRMASERATKKLKDIAIDVDPGDEETLQKIASTAMVGKGSYTTKKDFLSNILVRAAKQITESKDGEKGIDLEMMKFETKTGESVGDSELIDGMMLDKEKVHPEMPDNIEGGKIMVLNTPLETKEAESDTQIQISSPDQLDAFVEEEEKEMRKKVKKVKEIGANVVFCQKGIDDIAQYLLAKNDIYAVRRTKKSDIEKIAKATNAKIVTNIKDATKEDLGSAGFIEEKEISGDKMTFVRKCDNPKAVTLLIRGGTEHVLDEVKRSLKDALQDVASVIKTKKAVAGGGAPEIEIANELEKYANEMKGREQLAVKAFSESMEIVPRTLAENAGMDPINTIVKLKSAHSEGEKWEGVNVLSRENENTKDSILEPLQIKTQAIESAAEVAIMILRIDDVIAAGKVNNEESGGPGGMPGGGMPGGGGPPAMPGGMM